MAAEQRYCSKCRRTMAATKFYKYKSGDYCELCKACLTMHIDNYDEETFLWILEKFDVPYIPAEWKVRREAEFEKAYDKARNAGSKDPRNAAYNMTKGNSVVLGKYFGQMKLKQWNKFCWADTERLKIEAEEKAKLNGEADIDQSQLEEMKLAFANGEISEAQYMTYMDINPEAEKAKSLEDEFLESGEQDDNYREDDGIYPVNDNPFERVDIPDAGAELTQEDKIYLAMKWGRLYTAADWVALEKMWKDYETSFDLHNADLINGTKQLCKLDLKGNQALDSGDIDSYSKIARASDALRKSLKFTEAQRKEDKTSEFSCYGQIVAFAEKYNDEDYIRPIDLSIDRDIVDEDIRDIKNYTKQLIEDDPAVFKLIEQYIKKREILQEQEETAEDYELTDEDMQKYQNSIEEQRKIDNEEEEDE